MGKSITHAISFDDPRQFGLGPTRELVLIRCDDGSLYEFQKLSDDRIWSLRARGEVGCEPHEWTQRRAPLPSSVKRYMDDRFDRKWSK